MAKKHWTPAMRKAFARKMKAARAAKRRPRLKNKRHTKRRRKNAVPSHRKGPMFFIKAIKARTTLWYDGHLFSVVKSRRHAFATQEGAASKARELLRTWPTMKTYKVYVAAKA